MTRDERAPKGGMDDQEAQVRTVPALFDEEESEYGQTQKPRNIPDAGGRAPARASGAVLQTSSLTRSSWLAQCGKASSPSVSSRFQSICMRPKSGANSSSR